jgi:hypothetical protein
MRVGSFLLAVAAMAMTAFFAAAANAAPSVPLPGGKYVGKTDVGNGKRVVVNVRSGSSSEQLSGVVRFRCAGVAAHFDSDDGHFVAQKSRGGRTIFKARGRFASMNRARGTILRLNRGLRHGSCRASRFQARLGNAPRVHERTVTYGPFSVDPSMGSGPGHGGLNTSRTNIEKPCEDCSIVAMSADLTEADGRRANFDTQSMLHHVVLFNQSAEDATCTGWPERFFASGNERTPFLLPRGFGYDVNAGDHWRLITHLMNMSDETKDLYIKVNFAYVDGTSDLQAVKPFWLDINNCGNSEYETPAGQHTEDRDFTVTPEMAGRVVAIGGHLHDHGTHIMATDTTSGQELCDAVAGFDNDPSYMGHIDTVGGCLGRSIGTLNAGDDLRLSSSYDAPEALDNVMGIMVGYVAPSE